MNNSTGYRYLKITWKLGRVRIPFMVIIIELRLNLCIRGLKIALRSNLELGTRFAEVWFKFERSASKQSPCAFLSLLLGALKFNVLYALSVLVLNCLLENNSAIFMSNL